MEYLGVVLKNGRFNVDEMLEKISEKKLSDFKLSEIYDAIIENDNDAIMNGMCKKEYFNSLLYWAAPKIAFLIENNRPYQKFREKIISSEKQGVIYLIKISNNLYKFGRTKNLRKRFLQYPRGSQILKFEYVNNQIESEKILLNTVKEYNGKLYHGNEYFYFDRDSEPIEIFEKSMKKIETLNL